MTQKRHLAILGATGSIGTQALEIVQEHPEFFELEVLTANSNGTLLIEQAKTFRPNTVVIADESQYKTLMDELDPLGIKVFAGQASVEQCVAFESIDMVLSAIVGYAGLKPTLNAIENGKHIALANKETLVVAGELITRKARQNGVNIYPVDSEHSAIFQCLAGEFHNKIEKIYLTASGGPFRGKDTEALKHVTKDQALKHPNWDMGAKITIDSASLMNKGLETIEAKWLFDLSTDQIDVIVHPQSIIHSIVQFEDGSMKAQMGNPDMRVMIQYALTYPNRLASSFSRFSFLEHKSLTFEQPDTETFRNLALCYEAMQKGGNMPCVVNAANEVAVEAFLKDRVSFLAMSDVIEQCMKTVSHMSQPSLQDYIETDKEARTKADEEIDRVGNKIHS